MPDAESAYVEEQKVRGYLLCTDHPDGGAKAAFFMGFGFRVEDWEELSEALLRHARQNELVEAEQTPFGVQYAVEGPLRTPDEQTPVVRSVWERQPEEKGPRLITAYPGKERRCR
jgi:hypothetical protein